MTATFYHYQPKTLLDGLSILIDFTNYKIADPVEIDREAPTITNLVKTLPGGAQFSWHEGLDLPTATQDVEFVIVVDGATEAGIMTTYTGMRAHLGKWLTLRREDDAGNTDDVDGWLMGVTKVSGANINGNAWRGIRFVFKPFGDWS